MAQWDMDTDSSVLGIPKGSDPRTPGCRWAAAPLADLFLVLPSLLRTSLELGVGDAGMNFSLVQRGLQLLPFWAHVVKLGSKNPHGVGRVGGPAGPCVPAGGTLVSRSRRGSPGQPLSSWFSCFKDASCTLGCLQDRSVLHGIVCVGLVKRSSAACWCGGWEAACCCEGPS